jgi:cytochrome c oxidase subunit 3
MAATHVPASHAPISAAPEAPIPRPRVVMVGTAFAIAGSLIFFAGLLGVYLNERAALIATGGTWIPEKAVLPLQQPNVMLFALIASAVTMQWAVDAIRRDDRPQAYLALGVSSLFGFAVLNMAAYLYSIMNLDISIQSPAPVLIYVITGAHLLMLVIAMVFTALMSFRALGGQFTGRQHDGVSAAAMFWHAQVIVFAFIWYAIYVVK